MKTFSHRIVILVASLVLFAGLAEGQGEKQGSSATGKKSVLTRSEGDAAANAIQFPKVDGWTAPDKRPIPSPGDGYAVGYNSPCYGAVTVYLYSRGLDRIPDELGGVVKDEIEGAAGAIRQVASMGVYSDVIEGKTETVMLGGEKGKVRALRTQFTLTRGEQKMNSEIYVFPYKNNLVKLRITRSVAGTDEMKESFAKLLLALDSLFVQ